MIIMLNLIALDEDDRNLLQKSFNQIANNAEIITDKDLLREITNKVAALSTIPNGAFFSFQNLFRLNVSGSNVYIGQCLLDFGYPVKGKNVYSHSRVYELQIVGYSELNEDLGQTILRPRNKLDKLVGRFWDKSIKIENGEKFNFKYYLVSNKEEVVKSRFDKTFISAIASSKNLLLYTKSIEMLITFAGHIHAGQSKQIEQLFKKCSFLKKDDLDSI
jgi:hypothetical protein